MPRHSPCALISLTIFLVLRKNYAGHRSFSISRSNCSFTHNSTKKSVCFAFQRSTLCCLAYYLIILSIVQFSRCRQKIHFHVPSKLNKVRSPQKGLTLGSLFEWLRTCLLRKEVIQPLVLERLPCYDFTPITKPTFGRVLHCWLDYGLRVFPALMV